MRARLLGFLLIALMAFPAGWAGPAFFGADSAHETSTSEPCEGHDHASDDCPCCPDKGGSMADCLSSCVASVAVPASSLPVLRTGSALQPPVHAATEFTSRAELPFKPPPIR
jgi:hypothetical protein